MKSIYVDAVRVRIASRRKSEFSKRAIRSLLGSTVSVILDRCCELEGIGRAHEGHKAGAKARLVELDADIAADKEAPEGVPFDSGGSVGSGVGGGDGLYHGDCSANVCTCTSGKQEGIRGQENGALSVKNMLSNAVQING